MIRLLQGDCRDILPTLEAGSVHCCVTSPPYFGLRDYGTAQWDGGDAGCDHANGRNGATRRDVGAERLAARAALYGTGTGSGSDVPPQQFRHLCGKCGARRVDRQIGLEATPELYVAELVAVFREVRRVLRDDGTCWLNLGSAYCARRIESDNYVVRRNLPSEQRVAVAQALSAVWSGYASPEHSLPAVPSADQPQRDGCRQGTAGDRWGAANDLAGLSVPKRAIPLAFLPWVEPQYVIKPKDELLIPHLVAMALRADGWYLRQDIIWSKPNPMPESVRDRCTKAHEYVFLLSKSPRYYFDAEAIKEANAPRYQGESSGAQRVTDGSDYATTAAHLQARGCGGNTRLWQAGGVGWDQYNGQGRNRRSVWTIASEPFREAHFAVMPPELAETCIKAGCPEGGTVLDPFGGAGTTGLAADRLQRNAVLLELHQGYIRLQETRIVGDAPLFAQVEAA